jgi:hypothetical protein
MEYKFINRYGKTITFIKDENNIFEMKGGEYYRYLFNVDEEGNFKSYDAVDPSGGPFISVGTDLEYIDENLKGLIVEEINIDKKTNKILLKTNTL